MATLTSRTAIRTRERLTRNPSRLTNSQQTERQSTLPEQPVKKFLDFPKVTDDFMIAEYPPIPEEDSNDSC